jgi:EAL domain-containing protein (putative c-di-GMP-specific phosphodiesterase class I)
MNSETLISGLFGSIDTCRRAQFDDFGTGFATFNYLSKIAVDFIKIDGAFMKDLDSNSTLSVIDKSINQVGKSLGVKTIAECVENQATIELLAKCGVDYVQGYYLHKLEPLEQLLQGMEHTAPK